MKTFTDKYIYSFGDNLTNKQIEIIKDTLYYKSCELADELEELKQEVIREFKKSRILRYLIKRLLKCK